MKKGINLEEIFISCLKSNTRLKWYLHHDVDVVNFLDQRWNGFMRFADLSFSLIPKNKLKEIVGEMSKDRILKILERERPDLYKTLMTHKNGMQWLEQQIGNFEKRFL